MRELSRCRGVSWLLVAALGLFSVGLHIVFAEEASPYVLSEETFNRTLGALNDLRSKGLAINMGGGSLDSEIASLEKQPKAAKVIKKRGLSLREFVLTCKAAGQMREAVKARESWQKTLADPNTTPQAKLEATQKLGESLRTNLFTPEQMELARRKMPDLESLLPSPK